MTCITSEHEKGMISIGQSSSQVSPIKIVLPNLLIHANQSYPQLQNKQPMKCCLTSWDYDKSRCYPVRGLKSTATFS